ncbi:MAG: P-loop NTPase [Candidatus Omnitrophica bacterium]|nr:P-loop NTPase [Candidatus Omnitrophota bacterium]
MAHPIKNVIPVASGKGGVGKSTVSANLAVALAKQGAKTGLMDADVYGPSIPTLLGITDRPTVADGNRILPVEKLGVKVISMGFFIPVGEAVIWRGPMLHKMVQDFLGNVEWGELDILIVDLPPGTGDIQLSLCQTIPLTGAVIVSTPQEVAWNVAQKAIVMFDKLNAPILGIIENMSHYVCGHCGGREDIFGSGGARKAARILGIPFLGEIPLVKSVRLTSDQGDPIVHASPESAPARAIFNIAENLMTQVKVGAPPLGTKRVPSKIGAAGGPTIEIDWNDGKRTVYKARDLRLACPCARCVDEHTGQRTLVAGSVPAELRALSIHPVGRYALQIVWSDGHNTGLYGYDYLRKLEARS